MMLEKNGQAIYLKRTDFGSELVLEGNFDYIIIYNSIPHFNDLKMVFKNAFKYLKQHGKFVIAHSKTREGLKEYHKTIGYISNKNDPIPDNTTLIEICKEFGFVSIKIEDMDYFFFSCERE